MLKYISLVMLVMFSGIVGILKSLSVKERKTLLEDYLKMLLAVRGEISCFRQPILLFKRESLNNMDSKAFLLLNRFCSEISEKDEEISEVWRENVSLMYRHTGLKKEDIELMNYFGTFIGQSDYDSQISHFEYLQKKVESQIGIAECDYNLRGNLYKKLGFLAGGLAAVIFI